jgi:hypothetical protein
MGSPLREGGPLSPTRHFRVSRDPVARRLTIHLAFLSLLFPQVRLTCAFIYVRAKVGGTACPLEHLSLLLFPVLDDARLI